MKWFYLAAILLLGVAWCQANEEDLQDITKNAESDSEEQFYKDIKEEFEKKCEKVGGEEAVTKLTKVVDNLKICLSKHLPKNTEELKELKNSSEGSSSGSSEEICTEKRTLIQDCFNELVSAAKDCSEPEEKFVPDFLFDAIKGILDYICADQDAFIEKLIESFECIGILLEDEKIADVCDEKFEALLPASSKISETVLTKDLLCQGLETAKTCYGAYIKEKCPNSTITELAGGLYGAVHSGCEKKHRRSVSPRFQPYQLY